MMVVVLESSRASTEGDDGFQDISEGSMQLDTNPLGDGQGGGTVGLGRGSGWMRIKAYLHLITLSSREGSHFSSGSWCFWLLLYPWTRAIPCPPLENLLANSFS